METPICDFVKDYIQKETLRLHMPGHKGVNFTGTEHMDITEISGADCLYDAEGIIKKSEENASKLFGAHTFYSAEGSSLSIRAMLYLAMLAAGKSEGRPVVYAGRNAHKAFISAAALLDFDIEWIFGEESYLSCNVMPIRLDKILSDAKVKPVAVYITSPDYLGNIQDIEGISKVCKKHNVLLLVDNAHGAYLKFLGKSLHPIDLGADMCCDSAHKTLPVLTGGGYLHISNNADSMLKEQAKNALLLFGSTSPSYLILQSLDMANSYLENYKERLLEFTDSIAKLKEKLIKQGFSLVGNEPLKLTVMTKPFGYMGSELADMLRVENIECEFQDPDFVVMMFSPEMKEHLGKIEKAFEKIEKRKPVVQKMPKALGAEKVLSIRDACFSQKERLPVEECIGKISADSVISCPPAVSIAVCGEKIDENMLLCFKYYGTKYLWVIKE